MVGEGLSVSAGGGEGVDREHGGEVAGSGQAGILWGHGEDREKVGDGDGWSMMGDRVGDGKHMKRNGTIEGTFIDDIVLDTGCACTMVRCDLVPVEKLTVPASTIRQVRPWRCSHLSSCNCGARDRWTLAEHYGCLG